MNCHIKKLPPLVQPIPRPKWKHHANYFAYEMYRVLRYMLTHLSSKTTTTTAAAAAAVAATATTIQSVNNSWSPSLESDFNFTLTVF